MTIRSQPGQMPPNQGASKAKPIGRTTAQEVGGSPVNVDANARGPRVPISTLHGRLLFVVQGGPSLARLKKGDTVRLSQTETFVSLRARTDLPVPKPVSATDESTAPSAQSDGQITEQDFLTGGRGKIKSSLAQVAKRFQSIVGSTSAGSDRKTQLEDHDTEKTSIHYQVDAQVESLATQDGQTTAVLKLRDTRPRPLRAPFSMNLSEVEMVVVDDKHKALSGWASIIGMGARKFNNVHVSLPKQTLFHLATGLPEELDATYLESCKEKPELNEIGELILSYLDHNAPLKHQRATTTTEYLLSQGYVKTPGSNIQNCDINLTHSIYIELPGDDRYASPCYLTGRDGNKLFLRAATPPGCLTSPIDTSEVDPNLYIKPDAERALALSPLTASDFAQMTPGTGLALMRLPFVGATRGNTHVTFDAFDGKTIHLSLMLLGDGPPRWMERMGLHPDGVTQHALGEPWGNRDCDPDARWCSIRLNVDQLRASHLEPGLTVIRHPLAYMTSSTPMIIGDAVSPVFSRKDEKWPEPSQPAPQEWEGLPETSCSLLPTERTGSDLLAKDQLQQLPLHKTVMVQLQADIGEPIVKATLIHREGQGDDTVLRFRLSGGHGVDGQRLTLRLSRNMPNMRVWDPQINDLGGPPSTQESKTAEDGSLSESDMVAKPHIETREDQRWSLPALGKKELFDLQPGTVVQVMWTSHEDPYIATISSVKENKAGLCDITLSRDGAMHQLSFDPADVEDKGPFIRRELRTPTVIPGDTGEQVTGSSASSV